MTHANKGLGHLDKLKKVDLEDSKFINLFVSYCLYNHCVQNKLWCISYVTRYEHHKIESMLFYHIIYKENEQYEKSKSSRLSYKQLGLNDTSNSSRGNASENL